jgi:hypothetical protein
MVSDQCKAGGRVDHLDYDSTGRAIPYIVCNFPAVVADPNSPISIVDAALQNSGLNYVIAALFFTITVGAVISAGKGMMR